MDAGPSRTILPTYQQRVSWSPHQALLALSQGSCPISVPSLFLFGFNISILTSVNSVIGFRSTLVD